MEEAHSKFHILSHGFFACILYHFAPSFVNTNSFIKSSLSPPAFPLGSAKLQRLIYASDSRVIINKESVQPVPCQLLGWQKTSCTPRFAKRLSSGDASLPDCFFGSASRFFWGERWAAAHTCLRDFSPGNSYRNARRFLRFPISITLNPALRARDSNPLRLPSSLRSGYP